MPAVCSYLPIVISVAGPAIAFTFAGSGPLYGGDVGESRCIVRHLDGLHTAGTLVEISSERIVVRATERHAIPVDDVLRVDVTGTSPRTTTGQVVLLTNGDRILSTGSAIADDNLLIRPIADAEGRSLAVPLETVRGLILRVPENSERRAELTRIIDRRTERGDMALLQNGDRVTGEILELDQQRIVFARGRETVSVARQSVRAVQFDPALQSVPANFQPRAIVRLFDGSRLTANRIAARENNAVELNLSPDALLIVPLHAVRSIRWLGGRVVELGQVEPAASQHSPLLGPERAIRTDESVLGTPLRLRGRAYSKGLGMHAGHRATWRVDRRYRTFQATIGIDDSARGNGSVVFRVECDDRVAFRSDVLTGSDAAIRIPPIDISECMSLTLSVEHATGGDILDRANWCDAVMLRREAGAE